MNKNENNVVRIECILFLKNYDSEKIQTLFSFFFQDFFYLLYQI